MISTKNSIFKGFHWSNLQCTIHPFVIYFNENNQLKHISFVIIAESLKHNYAAVHLFQKKLIEFMWKRFSTINKIYFFSDGAGSQYKNKKKIYNICQLKQEFGINCEWHFFATSHGKGPCDGIGGTVKRLASKASLQRPYHGQITTSLELYNWAQNNISNIIFEYCSENDHIQTENELKNRYDNVKVIKGTQSFHCFIPIDKNQIIVKQYSNSKSMKKCKIT